jgi:hypothetical protein
MGSSLDTVRRVSEGVTPRLIAGQEQCHQIALDGLEGYLRLQRDGSADFTIFFVPGG